jgi:hypothetical protein
MDKESFDTTERRLENLVFHRFDVQNKIVYYLLAVNAACIGFTINFTKDVLLTNKELTLGLAVIFGGMSFYFGIVQIQNHENAIQLNINELAAYVKMEQVSEHLKIKQITLSKKGAKFRKCQNWFLLFGVLSFLVWHISKMT